jgi:hypothetical protein
MFVRTSSFLEERTGQIAQQETDRAQALDQKAAGLIAAALVLVAAGMAFASTTAGLHAGSGARAAWAALTVAVMLLLLGSLGFATAALWPQAFRGVIHLNVIAQWATHASWTESRPSFEAN